MNLINEARTLIAYAETQGIRNLSPLNMRYFNALSETRHGIKLALNAIDNSGTDKIPSHVARKLRAAMQNLRDELI